MFPKRRKEKKTKPERPDDAPRGVSRLFLFLFPHHSFFSTPGGPAEAAEAEVPATPPKPPVASSDPEAGGAGLYLPFDDDDDEEAPSHDAGIIFEIFLRILFSLTCCLCLSVAACFASGVVLKRWCAEELEWVWVREEEFFFFFFKFC